MVTRQQGEKLLEILGQLERSFFATFVRPPSGGDFWQDFVAGREVALERAIVSMRLRWQALHQELSSVITSAGRPTVNGHTSTRSFTSRKAIPHSSPVTFVSEQAGSLNIVRGGLAHEDRHGALRAFGRAFGAVAAFRQAEVALGVQGCYCSPSYALQLLNLRKNSYPFDWTRSSLEGILHCLDMRFEDFLTYSTYQMVDQHVVFGGTRWGGSFWHHNLEAPMTVQDMTRRIHRFLGTGDVSPKVPRVFIRIINSTREIGQAIRLRQALKSSFPEAQEIYMLLLIELQMERGPIAVTAPEGQGLFFFSFTEEEFRQVPAPGRHPLSLSGARCAEAIAAGLKWWAGEGMDLNVRTCDSLAQLSSRIYQFDGGDPARELFVPRRFWGQQLGTFGDGASMERLLSLTQQQAFVLPPGVDASKPFPVQCFGRYLQVQLPAFAQQGLVVQLFLNRGELSGVISSLYEGQLVTLAPVVVEDQEEPVKMVM
ncbi:unnamed protein product [Effrenium voratum]|nr:unnamed protein product [Effrenium voratum]